jgi:hypothetical protein
MMQPNPESSARSGGHARTHAKPGRLAAVLDVVLGPWRAEPPPEISSAWTQTQRMWAAPPEAG